MGNVLFAWFQSYIRRKPAEALHIEARVRRFLEDYLAADAEKKNDYYEVVAGAAAACQSNVANAALESIELARHTSAVALKVLRSRLKRNLDGDEVQSMITNAYATVAIANHRAAALYARDPEMQRLGTAAVHLVTIATSYIALTQRQT